MTAWRQAGEAVRSHACQRGADASAWFNWPEARVATFVPVSTPERP
jgi:hypothetical protein